MGGDRRAGLPSSACGPPDRQERLHREKLGVEGWSEHSDRSKFARRMPEKSEDLWSPSTHRPRGENSGGGDKARPAGAKQEECVQDGAERSCIRASPSESPAGELVEEEPLCESVQADAGASCRHVICNHHSQRAAAKTSEEEVQQRNSNESSLAAPNLLSSWGRGVRGCGTASCCSRVSACASLHRSLRQ